MFSKIEFCTQICRDHPDTAMLRVLLESLEDNSLKMRNAEGSADVSMEKNKFQIEFEEGTVVVNLPKSNPLPSDKLASLDVATNPRVMQQVTFAFELQPQSIYHHRHACAPLKRFVANFRELFGSKLLIPWTSLTERHLEKFKVSPPANFTFAYGTFGCYSHYEGIAEIARLEYAHEVQLGHGLSVRMHSLYEEAHKLLSQEGPKNFLVHGTTQSGGEMYSWFNSQYVSPLFNWRVSSLTLAKPKIRVPYTGSWHALRTKLSVLENQIWTGVSPEKAVSKIFDTKISCDLERSMKSAPTFSWTYKVYPLEKYVKLSGKWQKIMEKYYPQSGYDWFYPSMLPNLEGYGRDISVKRVNKFSFGA